MVKLDPVARKQFSKTIFLMVTSLTLYACGGGGGGSGSPPETTTTANSSVAAKSSVIAPGDAECAYGGVLVETGIDENGNGLLDDSEVDESHKVCNGAPGSEGLNALVNITAEAAGAQCAQGGQRIDSGLDSNADGVLDSGEITATSYICNGAAGADGSDGLNTLLTMSDVAAGANCPYGGIRLDSGLDVNSNGVLDGSEITETSFVCSFINSAIGWGVATRLETDPNDAASPQIAVDAAGNAIAVWAQHDGTRNNIWANRYTVGSGWGTAELLETDNTGSAISPQIVLDSAGNALAVWQQFDGTDYDIWANRYQPDFGWGTAVLIEANDTGDAYYPQIALDSAGNAIAVWQQSDGTRNDIWANRYLPGFGWGTPELIETDNVESAYVPQIAVDSAGNAIAVWNQYDGMRFNIWANRYVAGSGWGTAELIETDNVGDATNPQIALDSAGNAIAVWHQFDGTRNNIWANRYIADSGWGTAELIETDDTENARFPQIAVDAAGNAIVVWHQFDGARNNIWANRYIADSGWGTAELIETDNAGSAYYPQIAMDSAGNAIAVWHQNDGARYNIWANRYVAGSGWGAAELIETDNVGDATNPQTALDSTGNAIAVWRQSDGTRSNIWANRWQAP